MCTVYLWALEGVAAMQSMASHAANGGIYVLFIALSTFHMAQSFTATPLRAFSGPKALSPSCTTPMGIAVNHRKLRSRGSGGVSLFSMQEKDKDPIYSDDELRAMEDELKDSTGWIGYVAPRPIRKVAHLLLTRLAIMWGLSS